MWPKSQNPGYLEQIPTYFGIDGWRERARSGTTDCGSPDVVGGSGREVGQG